MVYKRLPGKPPSCLDWKIIVKVIEKLCAVYVGTEGDHIKYNRRVGKKVFVIIVPKYDDINGYLLGSIINQTGVSKKEFWLTYFNL